MLNWLRSIDWLSIGASTLLLVAIALAIHATGIDQSPNQQEYGATETQAAEEGEAGAAEQTVATYTKALAWFTGFLTLVTLVLAVASVWQGALTQRSIALARDEFHATHRPRLVLRFAKVTGTGPTTSITLTIANVGEGDGKILEISGELGWREKGDTKWSPESLNLKLEKIFLLKGSLLPSGDRRELVHISQFPSRGDEDQFILRSAYDELFFAGEVRYIDRAKIVRHTGFIRVSKEGGPLVRTGEFPDYEYQD